MFLERPCQSLTNTEEGANGNHWTEHVVPNGGVGGQTGGAEGVCSPIGRLMMSAKEMPQGSQGLSHQPKGTHGSSQRSGRGIPYWASVGKVVLCPVKAQ